MMRYQANTTPDNRRFDCDGDGKADIPVYRPSNGGWYQILSSQGNSSQIFG